MAATSIRVVSYHDPLVSLLDLIQCSTFSETTRKECTELVTTITNCSSSLPFSPQESLKIDSVYKHMYYKRKNNHLTPRINAASLRFISPWNPPG